jgi:hypothetical protein
MPAISGAVFPLFPMNNGILNGRKSMPQKDLTSDAENSFAMGRNQYVNTLGYQTNTSTAIQNHKKWMGNRDASQVTRNRRVSEIGVGSLNANNMSFAFTSIRDVNTVNDALRRTRGGGAVAPAKKNASKHSVIAPNSFPKLPPAEKYCRLF